MTVPVAAEAVSRENRDTSETDDKRGAGDDPTQPRPYARRLVGSKVGVHMLPRCKSCAMGHIAPNKLLPATSQEFVVMFCLEEPLSPSIPSSVPVDR